MWDCIWTMMINVVLIFHDAFYYTLGWWLTVLQLWLLFDAWSFCTFIFLEERMALLDMPDAESHFRGIRGWPISRSSADAISPSARSNHPTAAGSTEAAQSAGRGKACQSSAAKNVWCPSKWSSPFYQTRNTTEQGSHSSVSCQDTPYPTCEQKQGRDSQTRARH